MQRRAGLLLGAFLLVGTVNVLVQDSPAQSVPFECTGQGEWLSCIETDRARYEPGEEVHFSMLGTQSLEDANIVVRYFHLREMVDVHRVEATGHEATWSWTVPEEDFRGYLVVVSAENDAWETVDQITIGVDVSSDWSVFPRYGFLSTYANATSQPLESSVIDRVVRRLNRFHINGLQFYDWHYKHHRPLRGTAEDPAPGWRDVANRPVYFETIAGYISSARDRGMASMAYNLLFGAFRDAATDGVDMEAWGLFTDPAASNQDFHPLPDSWLSDIMLMNPAHPEWQDYLFAQMSEALRALPFDGWHVDQLGNRGIRYDADGSQIDLASTYRSFLENARSALGEEVDLVMNAVDQYGQEEIAGGPVEFLYSEVWSATTYAHLRQLLNENLRAGGGRLSTVLAAYMNYDLRGTSWFNTPSVLFTDAVIFASGGAHIELGEHMLSSEYFPSDRLEMSAELERRLIDYYDFLVAYQNLLRGDLRVTDFRLESDEVAVSAFQRVGTVWSFARDVGDFSVAHLINFTSAATLNWRDNEGDQTPPDRIEDVSMHFEASRPVERIWMASPDLSGGVAVNVAFEEVGDRVRFDLPSVEYWSMVVVEYATDTGLDSPSVPDRPRLTLGAPYPNPAHDEVALPVTTPGAGRLVVEIFDVLGRRVASLSEEAEQHGVHTVRWDGRRPDGSLASSGIYFYRFTIGSTSAGGTFVFQR